MCGASSKENQVDAKLILGKFELLYLPSCNYWGVK